MTPRTIPPDRAASRQHLIRRLAELIERTFTTEGHERAMEEVTEVLSRLDDEALRGYAYLRGIQTEDQLEPEEPDAGERGAAAG